jgi:hypothetical protein
LVLLPDTDQHIQPFLLCLFQRYGLTFAQASLDCDCPILCFLPLLGWQVCTTIPSFFLLRWDLTNFFFAWAGLKLWFSQSQPPTQFRMTGTCHWTQPLVEMGVLWSLAWNIDPPNLNLLRSQNYRSEPPPPGLPGLEPFLDTGYFWMFTCSCWKMLRTMEERLVLLSLNWNTYVGWTIFLL